MTTTATGANAIAIEKLANMIALSTTFRAGRTQAAALAESVLWWGRDQLAEERHIPIERPFAVIEHGGQMQYELSSGGGQDYFVGNGHLWLYFEIAWPADYYGDKHNATNVVSNWFDVVVREALAYAGKDITGDIGSSFSDGSGDLPVMNASQLGIGHCDTEKFPREEWFWSTEWDVHWGVSP